MLEPVILDGTHIRLEPMEMQHLDALCAVGLDEDLWRVSAHPVTNRAEMKTYMETALAWQRAGTALPFVTRHKATDQIVGSTRYAHIVPAHLRLEIGWTWVARAWHRTVVNTEAKFLLLHYAFETLGYRRVEFKTDVRNARSRHAILRIGAKEEGILRKHMVTHTGHPRDSVYFSILDEEWPAVRAWFLDRLART